jgi:PIN domain nuclease of toxin-antitoxin system
LHRNPFDGMLVAQAISKDLLLVTGDELLAQCAAPTLQTKRVSHSQTP